MDPSGFNLNRIGNAMKATEDWRKGKRRGPRSLWAPIVVILIIGAILFLVFHPSWNRTNWSILKDVPSAQAHKVKKAVRKLKYQVKVPAKIPFKATGAVASLTNSGSYVQTIKLEFKTKRNAIQESVTNGVPLMSQVNHVHSIKLSGGRSAVAGLIEKLPTLSWKDKGISYTLSITKWGKNTKPSVQKLIEVYNSMY